MIDSAGSDCRRTPSIRAVTPSSDVSIRAARSATRRRNRSVSRVSFINRAARRTTMTIASASATSAASASSCARNSIDPPTSPDPRSARPGAKLGDHRRDDLEQVADDDDVGELGNRRIGVAVHRDDRIRRLHPDLVLDRTRNAKREIQLRLHDLAGLPDLLAVRNPAGVDGGPCRTDDATELRRELLDELESLGATDAAATGDDDLRLLDRGRLAGLRDAVDDLDLRKLEVAGGSGGFDRTGLGGRLRGDGVRADRHD